MMKKLILQLPPLIVTECQFLKLKLNDKINFEPIILPKKTIFQLCSILEDFEGDVKISNIKSKIKFEMNNSILISKLIDGKVSKLCSGYS